MKLDRFYPIFDSADWIARLVPLGIKLVQLRIKDANPDMIRDHVRRSKSVCADHDCMLVINDHWQIAINEGCHSVHLGQEDLDDADIAAIRLAGLRLGVSTHDKAELVRAKALNPDYIALGPIYPTILKKMKWHEQGTAKLTTWRQLIGNTPLVAIGGMRIDRAQGAFDAGADVVAAVTDITLHDSPKDRVAAWLAATR
jgi:thiamine-phosphate pyrophosphorylase